MILYIKHIDIEGPGTLGEYLHAAGLASETIEMTKESALPDDLSPYSAIISLGGPMSVYDEEKYPLLAQENEFIKEVLKKEIPFMGLCLGSQLLAKASGSRVIRSPGKEIGFYDVELTPEGKKDSLFKGIKNPFNVFQWHEDMSIVPDEGTLLAKSDLCPIQAFKMGACAYALQFHIEVTDVSIEEWTVKYIKSKHSEDMLTDMLEDYEKKKDDFDNIAKKVYENFLKIIKEHSKVKVN